MFWLLIIVMFSADGTKQATVLIEPPGTTGQKCADDANKLAQQFHDHATSDIIGVGLKCDGPLDDPAILKRKAGP